MKTMPAGEFKARCLRVMEDVRKYRTPIVITKKGKPVAKLVPPDEPKKDIFGAARDLFTYVGDVESPVLPPIDQWDMYRLPLATLLGPEHRRRKGKRRPRRPRKTRR